MLSAQKAEEGLLLISTPSDIHGSVVNDTIVQKNCTLHVRGNLLGSLTIESGAKVVVEGSVDGKIINKGGRLVVNNKGLAACVTLEGPPEAEACGILKFNLTALASNWEMLGKRSEAECAAVVKGNAYGCGIDPVAGALAKSGCKTFFVSNIPEARRVRAVAPGATIYVLNGFYSGTGPAFADVNARPVINSAIEMAEWDVFVAERQWMGGCALNVDTGESRLGLSMEEAVAFAQRLNTSNHGITLLMSHLDHADKPGHPQSDRQIGLFRDLRRLYDGVPASLANSSGIFSASKIHFDLVRAGAALFGVNPTPGQTNPMLAVHRVARADRASPRFGARRNHRRQCRLDREAADAAGFGFSRLCRRLSTAAGAADGKLSAVVGGHRCPVAGRPSTDLLPIDVTDLPDPAVARYGAMVTLIGAQVGIDELAAATKSTAAEVLSGLGHRFHRIYYAI